MNTKNILLLGGLGLGLYLLLKSNKAATLLADTPPSSFETIPSGTQVGEYKITVDINNPRQGVDWINDNIFGQGPKQYYGAGQSTVNVDYQKGQTVVTSRKGGTLKVNTTRYTPPQTGVGKRTTPNKNAAAIAKYLGK